MSDSPPDTSSDKYSMFALVDLRSGRAHPLRIGTNSIGRSAKSHIVLDHDAVSRRHAVLTVCESGECEIDDHGSRNGVSLNGRRIHETTKLTPGTLLQIHKFRLLLIQKRIADESPTLFTDEILGIVVWNAAHGTWHFGMVFDGNEFVSATYSPTDSIPPDQAASSPEWNGVRAWRQRMRLREQAVRSHIEAQGDPHGMPTKPHLAQLLITADVATFIYEEPNYGTICVSIGPTGTILTAPAWFLDGMERDD